MKLPDPSHVFGRTLPPVESIIEGPFRETTRNGKQKLRSVQLALNPGVLLVTESRLERILNYQENDVKTKISALYLVDSLKISVFKKSQRQTLKICFEDECYRYFELEKSCGRQMLWTMWCKKVIELQQRNTKIRWIEKLSDKTISLDWNVINQKVAK